MHKNPRQISLIGSRATSVLSVALVLIIIGLCATLGLALHRASTVISDETTVMATVYPEEDPLRVSEIKRQFNNEPWILRYEFTDAATVLSREVSAMDSVTRLGLSLLADNPFGGEFVIHLSQPWRNSDSIAVVARRLEAIPGIDIVSADASALGDANDGMRRVLLYAAILAAVLLVISVVLINNTISLSIYSRRFNIHTMKLVGATDSFIRRPFVRAGMMTGVVAGLIAALVLSAVQSYLMFSDNLVGTWITVTDIAVTAVVLVILGALIARCAAWCSATAYLRKSYDDLFKK